jgi:hypothetical protein
MNVSSRPGLPQSRGRMSLGRCRPYAPSTRADPDAALAKQVDVNDTLVAKPWAGRVAGKGGAFPLTPVRGNIAYSTG